MSDNDPDDRRALTEYMICVASWACSQSQPNAEQLLAAAAYIINKHNDAWGIEVRLKYLGQGSPLAPYIAADLRRRQWASDKAEWEPPLSAERAKLVADHMQLVRKYAGDIARGNDVLFSELEVLGLYQLEKSARQYDELRGVTFGAYARKRLRGAMLDHAVLNRNRVLAVGGIKEIDEKIAIVSRPGSPSRAVPIASDDIRFRESPPDVRPPTHARETDSSSLVLEYLKGGGAVRHSRKQPAANMADIEKLVLKLNHRQRTVYQDMVLTDPPLSRAEVARKINTDVTQVSRIKKQAERKMAAWLKVR